MNLRTAIARMWVFLTRLPLSEVVVRLLLCASFLAMTFWFLVDRGLPSSLYVVAWSISLAGAVGVVLELVLAAMEDDSEDPTDDTDNTAGRWEMGA